jgi:hypothetical protein
MNRVVYSPKDSDSAARFLAECSRLAGEGRDVSVTVNDSEPGESVADETGLEKIASGGISASILYDGLAGIIELSSPDMLVRAKGGTAVSDIVSAAEESLLRFPHYDSTIGREMTIAELLMEAPALGISESMGGLREYVLSVELVTGAGEKVRFGSRSVKDVAGYEVIGLLLGGGGRYGMITEATLRLIPGKAGKPGQETLVERLQIPETGNTEAVEKLAASIRGVFDPAGILR